MSAAFLVACSGTDPGSLFAGTSGGGTGGGSNASVPRGGASTRLPPPPPAPALLGPDSPSSTGGISVTPTEGLPTLAPPSEQPSEPPGMGDPPPSQEGPPPTPPGEIEVEVEEAPIGWASVDADGQPGTFGGRGGEVVLVDTAAALRAALQGAAPRIVRVTGSLFAGVVAVGSNKTLEGAPGVVITVSLDIDGQQNVIVRDLKLVGFGCSAGIANCDEGNDVVEIRDSHHVWVHHTDIADGTDGNLDIVEGSSYITVSWSKFSYQTAKSEHRLSNLVGAADDVEADVGRLNVTWHNNWWADNVDQGMPRTRRGDIHVFNNLYTAANNTYCTNAGFEASLLVENNVYVGVNRPLALFPGGDMLAQNNLFVASEPPEAAEGVGFVPPYPYTLTEAALLEQVIRTGAGPRSGG